MNCHCSVASRFPSATQGSLDIFNALASKRLSKMKNNYLHTANTTKKSSARARPVFRAFGVVAAVTLAGVALAAGPEHRSVRSSKSQIVAENTDASNTLCPLPVAWKRQESNSREVRHSGNARLLPRPRRARPAGPGTQRRRSAHNRRLSHRNPRSRPLL